MRVVDSVKFSFREVLRQKRRESGRYFILGPELVSNRRL